MTTGHYVNSKEAAEILSIPLPAFQKEVAKNLPAYRRKDGTGGRLYSVADLHAIPHAEVLLAVSRWREAFAAWRAMYRRLPDEVIKKNRQKEAAKKRRIALRELRREMAFDPQKTYIEVMEALQKARPSYKTWEKYGVRYATTEDA